MFENVDDVLRTTDPSLRVQPTRVVGSGELKYKQIYPGNTTLTYHSPFEAPKKERWEKQKTNNDSNARHHESMPI